MAGPEELAAARSNSGKTLWRIRLRGFPEILVGLVLHPCLTARFQVTTKIGRARRPARAERLCRAADKFRRGLSFRPRESASTGKSLPDRRGCDPRRSDWPTRTRQPCEGSRIAADARRPRLTAAASARTRQRPSTPRQSEARCARRARGKTVRPGPPCNGVDDSSARGRRQ